MAATTLTIDGNNAGAVFNIQSGTVALSNLIIQKGSNGGIQNNGTLTVSTSTITNNTSTTNGGGIANFGTLTINTVAFNNNQLSGGVNGGAIYNSGTLTISNSMFTGNTPANANGGAIWADINSQTTITASTFNSNGTLFAGGAIYQK